MPQKERVKVWLGSRTNRIQEVIPVSRKNPYSLVDVNQVRVESLVQQRRGQTATVGVDVAKGELVACVVWPDRVFERPWRVKSPSQVRLGVQTLLELNRHCPVIVAMESSGTYGDPLRQALADSGIEVRRVSSKSVKDHAETFDGVPSQHDGKDAAIIGTLCVEGHGKPWAWGERPQQDQAIRYWVRKLDTAQRIKQVFSGKLESLLARHWPEAGGLLKPSGATLPAALAHWGDPRALGEDVQAAEQLARFGRHYLTAEKIARVIESARTTIGVRMNAWAAREMKQIAQAILEQRRQIQDCRGELKKLTAQHKAIQSQAPAVGLITACVLWMCLGDAANYGSAAAYRKAMGLNLKERSSGVLKGKLTLTKRGQRLTRKWLYFSALRWMRDPSVKRWVEQKKARDGGRGDKAAVGVMRRLALAAWHTGQGEVFDVNRLFPGVRRSKTDKSNSKSQEVTAM
jgi:transposase